MSSRLRELRSIKPKLLNLSEENLVQTRLLFEERSLPLVVEPVIGGVALTSWAKSNKDFIDSRLSAHGAILFRGFDIAKVEEFHDFVTGTSGPALDYLERSSPRSQVADQIYTSTDHPADQSIFLHNENSYKHIWPQRIFFLSSVVADEGGETPIADIRKVYMAIPAEVREKFVRLKILYVRNLTEEIGMPWQTAFQTTDRSVVEDYCRHAGIKTTWKSEKHLTLAQVRDAVYRHPSTGEPVWFNHATFFHISTLPPAVRSMLLEELTEGSLPANSFYGDGSEIEPDVLDALRAAYLKEKVVFRWQKNDLLVLDNMLAAHGREPYSGNRKVLVAMAQPVHFTDPGIAFNP
ncbi:MAG TPA: TauD/TfdA family dioxygenase, partial [Blastocatellia bacterium]|nr:TauD/TfdA family dioxygenase [Blastocatellia bacterium]